MLSIVLLEDGTCPVSSIIRAVYSPTTVHLFMSYARFSRPR